MTSSTSSSPSKQNAPLLKPDQLVWIAIQDNPKAEETYRLSKIVEINDIDNKAKIIYNDDMNNTIHTVSKTNLYIANDYSLKPNGYDDMVNMDNLSEAELLYNIKIRFEKRDQIYTYVGSTLLIINPYTQIPGLLSIENEQLYQSAISKKTFLLKDYPPHIYAIAALAMKSLLENKKNQALVISGESGAGKTESTKQAMSFLASVGRSIAKTEVKQKLDDSIEARILACNPILEAFGNAKTVRNDNSSRFGKYVTLLIHKESKNIRGATIMNYLLEKSRLVAPGLKERNYHIFYMLFKYMSNDKLKELMLTHSTDNKADMSKYYYLSQAKNYDSGTYNDQEEYQKLMEAFQITQFKQDEVDAIWKIIAACMHLGQIEFDESTLTDSAPCSFKDKTPIEYVCKLLGINYEEIIQAIRIKIRNIPGSEPIPSPLFKDECINYKDSMAKALYNNLFNWLVKKLNNTVLPEEMRSGLNTLQIEKSITRDYYTIGLLDIFGFENMDVNSFEQFCINYANERLQQLYINYVFEAEQQEFINQGLKDYLCLLNYQNNKVLIDMMDSQQGIFQLVDESSTINSNDEKLLANIIKIHKNNPRIYTTTRKKDTFTIVHSAKDVDYSIIGFRIKNKDELSPYISKVIMNSSNPIIVKIWKNISDTNEQNYDDDNNTTNSSNSNISEPKANSKASDKFLGAKFRLQMKDLMNTLEDCQCHFIRCIKPNEERAKRVFNATLTLKQIKYMGILDTIIVRRESYPYRKSFKDFYEKYEELNPVIKIPFEKLCQQNANFKDLTMKMIEKIAPQLDKNILLFGNAKIFMRNEALAEIERLLEECHKKKRIAAIKFKNSMFRVKQLKRFRNMLKGVKKIQKLWIVRQEYRRFQSIRKATRKIQSWWLRILFNRRLAKAKQSAKRIQYFLLMSNYRIKFLRKLAASQMINRVWRGAIYRKFTRKLKTVKYIIETILNRGVNQLMYKVREEAVQVIQRYARGYITRCRYYDIVCKIRKAKLEFVFDKNARIIQKYIRGFIVRSTLLRLHRAAFYIQGYFRMRWLSSLFQKLRSAAKSIQRAARRWLIRKKMIRQRLEEFLLNDNMENVSSNRGFNTQYLKNINCELGQKMQLTINTHNNASNMSEIFNHPNIPNETNILTLMYQNINLTKEISPYTAKKINLTIRVIDIDMLTDLSDVYDPSWAQQSLQLQKDCVLTDNDLQMINVGSCHTLAISNSGKAYSWGWNDNYQLGRSQAFKQYAYKYSSIDLPQGLTKLKCFAVGDNHNAILDHWGNLLIWGSNDKYQLGLGHCRDVSRMISIDIAEKNDKVVDVRACGDNTLVITENGKAYYWPYHGKNSEVIGRPIELNLHHKVQICTASCGYDFAILVSKSGHVYSFGKDNREGQLGLGDKLPREIPTLVESLKKDGERITAVACGFKHVIAKTSLGKIYTWGWGVKGQLGHGLNESETIPKLVNLGSSQSKIKVLQATAGYKHSAVLLENKKILWWGTNATIKQKNAPIEVNLSAKIPDIINEFTPTRILCSWSKTMSITYITLADTRSSDLPSFKKQKILTTLITKIEDSSAFNDIDPPYVDSISKYFPAKVMKTITKKNNNISSLNHNGLASSPNRKLKGLNMTTATTNMTEYDMTISEKKTGLIQPIMMTTYTTNNNHNSNTDSVKNYDTFSPFKSEEKIKPSTRRIDQEYIADHQHGVQEVEEEELDEERRIESNEDYNRDMNDDNLYEEYYNNDGDDGEGIDTNDDDDMEAKLKEIKKKMNQILKVPREKWSANDVEFMNIATEPKMFALLNNLKD